MRLRPDDLSHSGIGMTSQRTRERLIQRLYEEGLSSAPVLEVIRRTPRHLFVDEALAHRPMRTRRCRSATTRRFPSPTW